MLSRERLGEEMAPEPAGLAAHPLFAPLGTAAREACRIAYLAPDWRLLGSRHVAGAASWVDLPVRTVATDALALDAARVVMAHNHPGGDPRPSRGDLCYTRRLARGLDALGVVLFDHLVIAGTGFTSLRREGLL